MKEFRIVPAMHMERVTSSCTRYGFIIPDHPLGVPESSESGLRKGDYLATWETPEIAFAAAFCLGVPEWEVAPIAMLFPDRECQA